MTALNLARKAVAVAGDRAEEIIYIAQGRGYLKTDEKEEVLEKICQARVERYNIKGYED